MTTIILIIGLVALMELNDGTVSWLAIDALKEFAGTKWANLADFYREALIDFLADHKTASVACFATFGACKAAVLVAKVFELSITLA